LGRFANKPIRSITLTQIEKWRNDELDRAPNQTVKAFKQLKTLLTWAHKRKWISENPCDFIDGATTYKWEEPEVPTDAQVEHMLDKAPEPYRTIIALAVFGGLRKGEILELRRKDIEIKKVQKEAWVRVSIKRAVVWVKGEAIVKAPKSSKSVRVIQLPLPATPFVKNLLKSMNSIDPEALLFSRDPEGKRHFLEYQLDSPWRQIKKSSGFNGRFHSLRTYHETRLARSTSSPKQLMDRLGHEDLKTTMLYLRNGDEEDERNILRKW
jgi:integrase